MSSADDRQRDAKVDADCSVYTARPRRSRAQPNLGKPQGLVWNEVSSANQDGQLAEFRARSRSRLRVSAIAGSDLARYCMASMITFPGIFVRLE